MMDTCRRLRAFVKIVFLLGLAACVGLSWGQSRTAEVEIMVNGPFDYVQDPYDSKRVVVMAPASQHHTPVTIFPGNNAANNMPSNPTGLQQGVFRLDFSHNPNTASVHSDQNVLTISQNVDVNSVIKPLVNSSPGHTPMSRYAISLPKPDYYTTYKGRFGRGVSQSIISSRSISDPGTIPDARTNYYTVWMVLHYRFNTAPTTATLSGSRDDGVAFPSTPVPFNSDDGAPIKAISIQQAGMPDLGNDSKCDTYSHHSFQDSLAMWHLANLYALFPELTGPAPNDGQIADDFHYDCDYTSMTHSAVLTTLEKEKICKNSHGEWDAKDGLCLTSTGSADCHKSQMSINKVVK